MKDQLTLTERQEAMCMSLYLDVVDAALENYPDNAYDADLDALRVYTFGRNCPGTKDALEAVLACREAVLNLYEESRANFGVIRAEYCDKDAADRDFENLAQAYFEEAQSCYDEAREEVDLLLDD